MGETNPLTAEHKADFHNNPDRLSLVYWTEPGLRVVRLRLLSDPGYPEWDVSYCHGYVGDEPVQVQLPFSRLPKRGWARAIVAAAIKDGVHARRMGVLDNVSMLQ